MDTLMAGLWLLALLVPISVVTLVFLGLYALAKYVRYRAFMAERDMQLEVLRKNWGTLMEMNRALEGTLKKLQEVEVREEVNTPEVVEVRSKLTGAVEQVLRDSGSLPEGWK
jgi:predicted membrane chloride channel (bestrophin family)